MPAKRKRPPRRDTQKPGSKPIRLIVRRGAQNRFDSLRRKAKDLNVVIEWDRREGERRKPGDRDTSDAAERRKAERRQKPPFTWDSADFVVVIERDDAPKVKAKAKG